MGSTLARDVLANLARVPGLEIHLIGLRRSENGS